MPYYNYYCLECEKEELRHIPIVDGTYTEQVLVVVSVRRKLMLFLIGMILEITKFMKRLSMATCHLMW